MTAAIHQYDTYLVYSTTAAEGPFTELQEVTKISTPKRKGSKADATHLRSPNFTKEQIRSWADPGEAGATVNFQSSVHDTFLTLQESGDFVFWRLYLPFEPGAATRAYQPFTAQVTGVSLSDVEASQDKVHQTEIEFAVSATGDFVPAT